MKALKSELAALDRIIAQALSQKEITADLVPKHEEDEEVENKQHLDTQMVEVRNNQSRSNDSKR